MERAAPQATRVWPSNPKLRVEILSNVERSLSLYACDFRLRSFHTENTRVETRTSLDYSEYDEEWNETDLDKFFYDGEGRLESLESYYNENDDWVREETENYSYNGAGMLETITGARQWDEETSEYEVTITYDDSDRPERTETRAREDGGEWEDDFRQTWIYSEGHRLDEILYQYQEGGEWVDGSRFRFEFDEDGRMNELVIADFDAGGWTDVERAEIENSDDGSPSTWLMSPYFMDDDLFQDYGYGPTAFQE